MLSVLDLFSGIGGFSLGIEKAGMKTIGFCEIEPFCQSILKKHWPEVPVFNDITKLNGTILAKNNVSEVNLMVGGFPCQDISCAGKQKGIGGSRSGLWKEYKRLIDELRPDYAIIENVANLRSRGLVTVLQDLWKIGYDVEWHCIPASAIGAPHRRDRIWIIAHSPIKGLEGRLRQGTEGDRSRFAKCGENFSHSDSAGCICNKSPSAGKDGEKRWQECATHPIAGGNLIAGEKFSIYETGFEKEATTKGLQNSKAILANPDSAGLQRYRRFEEACQILSQETLSLLRSTAGIVQWGVEPNIPRLKDEKLNPDWVEWLMGFPEGWTSGGTRKQRLIALGNAVVPIIPEYIANCINSFAVM